MSKSRSSSEPPQPTPSLYETFGARLFGLNTTVSESEDEEGRDARLPSFTHEWSKLENTVKRAHDCACFQVVNPQNLKSCKLCQGTLPVVNLFNEIASLKSELSKTTEKMEIANIKADHAQMQVADYKKELDTLLIKVAEKEKEIESVKRDLDTIGEKLVDELERRGELQHAKDALQGELEELTRSLFEEANSMVSKEARARKQFEDHQNQIQKELDATRIQLQMEQGVFHILIRGQLRELKLRMENVILENQKLKSKRLSSLKKPMADLKVEPIFDQEILNQFTEFIQLSSKTKLNKIHNIPYLQIILEDDVLPCLRFGVNPRIRGKKLVDSIASNSLFVEEMTESQILLLEQRDENMPIEKLKYNPVSEASPGVEDPTSPATGINSPQSVFTRLSTAINNIRGSVADAEFPGCSACGNSSEKYRYQFKLIDISGDNWYPICLSCRGRLVAVANFYNFIRHLRQGLYSTRKPKDLYVESLKLRKEMFFSRIEPDAPELNSKSPSTVKPNSMLVNTGMYADPLLVGKSNPTSPGGGIYTFKESIKEDSEEKSS